ncbi:hypothetical protein LTR50_004072 [Elasticomyces elasticus]|nr:hypothetical protein LTR50_004072 [Elasticomyces elasticus]
MGFSFNSLAFGLAAAASISVVRAQSASSPPYNYMYQFPVPVPPIAAPAFTEVIDGIPRNYYEMTVEPFQKTVFPNLGPANLVGYNASAPGPTYYVPKGTESIIRVTNNASLSSVVHLHGSYTHSPWDGWANDEIQPGQYKDYYYPNSQSARSIWFHDHAATHTSHDAYYGQGGMYIIYDPAEDALGLPRGQYDTVLALSDKIYQSSGDLWNPDGQNVNFYGDVIQVNEQPWPYFAVEPRKYRLRFFDMSLSRPYNLYFQDTNNKRITFQVIASDAGLFGGPVSTSDVTIAMGERYEIVIDFAAYAGQNITLRNGKSVQTSTTFANTDKVMRFMVGNTVTDKTNNGDVPSVLNPNIKYPKLKTTVDHTFDFDLASGGTWTINGVSFSDVNNRVLARPPQGSVELWELRYRGGPGVHPVHVHLVDFQIISRSGGSNRGVMPYETAGLKDIVLLEPGETVRVLAYYGPWNGLYMFHCHNLIHEDHSMMAVFNSTKLEDLGYDNAQSFADPLDKRFAPKAYNQADYALPAIKSAVESLASLSAYVQASAVAAALDAHYSTAPFAGEGAASSAAATTAGSRTTTAGAQGSTGGAQGSTAMPWNGPAQTQGWYSQSRYGGYFSAWPTPTPSGNSKPGSGGNRGW